MAVTVEPDDREINDPEIDIPNPDKVPKDNADQALVHKIEDSIAQRAAKERLGIDQIRQQIKDYEGDGFTEASQEKSPLPEFLQRLKASRGRYFGNIVHQGARDHSGMDEHSGNEGEYNNEIEQVIESAHLKSNIRRLLDNETALQKACEEVREIQTKEDLNTTQAIERYIEIHHIQGFLDHQQITDALATHVSSNHILDSCYGTETGNECFVVLPEDLALQEKQFWSRAGVQSTLTEQYNDVYIWPTGHNPGKISTNGALFFIPRDNTVGDNSGSLYEIQEGNAVFDIEKLDNYAKNVGRIALLKEQLIKTLGDSSYDSPQAFLLQNHYIEIESDGNYSLTWSGERNLDSSQKAAVTEYFAFLKSINLDPKTLDSIPSYRDIDPNFYEQKLALEAKFSDKPQEQISKLLNLALFHNYGHGEIGSILFALLENDQLKKSYQEPLLKKAHQTLIERGFDIEALNQALSNPENRKIVLAFIKRFANTYSNIAKHSKGSFFKKTQSPVRAKDYYEKFILGKLKNLKIQEIADEDRDIVEYRGTDENGTESVVRVVYYKDKDPNQAVQSFYESLGIKFDNRIIDTTEKHKDKETDFKVVPYRHDIDELKRTLATRLAA